MPPLDLRKFPVEVPAANVTISHRDHRLDDGNKSSGGYNLLVTGRVSDGS